MPNNKIENLRDHLFEQLERLNDEDLSTEEMNKEVKRAKAMSQISSEILNSAKTEISFLNAVGGTAMQGNFIPVDASDNKPQIGN